jgi:hypothetical protein
MKQKKCGMSKCRKEIKARNKSRRIAEKQVSKKCDKKACEKFYPCVSKMNPLNLTKKFKNDYKGLQNELIKKCDPEKVCDKSQKCSRKIYKKTGFSKALIDLIDCKIEKCPLV